MKKVLIALGSLLVLAFAWRPRLSMVRTGSAEVNGTTNYGVEFGSPFGQLSVFSNKPFTPQASTFYTLDASYEGGYVSLIHRYNPIIREERIIFQPRSNNEPVRQIVFRWN